MDFLKKTVEQPALETKIKSDEVKIQEIALGYFLAPFCAMLANSIFGATFWDGPNSAQAHLQRSFRSFPSSSLCSGT